MMQGNQTPTGMQNYPTAAVSENDKLMALLAYVFSPLTAGIFLLLDSTKQSPFLMFHSKQALGIGAANIIISILITIVGTVLATVTCGLGCLLNLIPLAIWVMQIYYGIQAYNGKYFDIPYLSQFMRQQGWLQ